MDQPKEGETDIDMDVVLMRDRVRRAHGLLGEMGTGPNLVLMQAMNMVLLQDLTDAVNRLADRADRRTFGDD